MRMIKHFLVVVTVVFLAILGYANFRHLTPTQRLKPVSQSIFQIDQQLSAKKAGELREKILEIKGVRSCIINPSSQLVSVIYDPNSVSESTLISTIQERDAVQLSKKTFAAVKGGCPVHAVSDSFHAFVSSLDLRLR